MLKRSSLLWGTALAAAWLFDFLFWKKQPGISFAIFVGILLLGGFLVALSEGARPARASLALLVPLVILAVFTFLRAEPFTVFVDVVLVLGLMLLMAHSFQSGRWWAYNIVDYIGAFILVAGSAFGRGATHWLSTQKAKRDSGEEAPARQETWKRSLPVLRGLLLALPVVVLFSALLASADLVFNKSVQDLLNLFNLEKLPEYLWRLFYIVVLAYLLAGVYLHILHRKDQKVLGDNGPLVKPFFGMTEAGIVLGSVNLLFAFFVAIQFRYFFGGSANISVEGYTYSEYARRGFNELLAVVFFSLLLFLSLSSITHRKTPSQRWLFSGLGALQVVLLAVILVSAFQRLSLYEDAYGFTRLRTYTYILMIWIGVLLLAFLLLELSNQLRYYLLATALCAVGFALTVNLLNVDAFIVRQNTTRAIAGQELDAEYLVSLSSDAVPALTKSFQDPRLPKPAHDKLGAVLSCQAHELWNSPGMRDWRSYHASEARAEAALNALGNQLTPYTVVAYSYVSYVEAGPDTVYCRPQGID